MSWSIFGTKTFWVGVGGVGLGIYQVATGDAVGGIQSILAGFGAMFLRDAILRVSS
jgi:hypothetical protein